MVVCIKNYIKTMDKKDNFNVSFIFFFFLVDCCGGGRRQCSWGSWMVVTVVVDKNDVGVFLETSWMESWRWD